MLSSFIISCVLFEDDDAGVRRSELVNWYLKEMESEIDSEAELIEKKTLCEKVIYRLVHHVSENASYHKCVYTIYSGMHFRLRIGKY